MKRSGWLLVGFALAGLFHAAPVDAQRPDDLAGSCIATNGADAGCGAAAVAADALLGTLAVAAVSGNPVPGTATTLGQRVGGGVKLAFSLRAQRVGSSMPDLDDASFAAAEYGATAVTGGVAVGLYEGSRIMSTVGGFLSVDAFANLSMVFLPDAPAFETDPSALSVGVRLGVLREGFTVPGIALSVSRTWIGASSVTGSAGSATIDPVVTAVRATVGKDVGGFEFLGGWGWDDRSGQAEVSTPGASATGTLDQSGQQWFGGLSRTFGIVLNLGGEVGRAGGGDTVTTLPTTFSPGARWYVALFGRLSL